MGKLSDKAVQAAAIKSKQYGISDGDETAHRALSECGRVFRYAVASDLVKRDPAGVLRGALPRAYSKELYEDKCSAVFEHVYQSYQGEGASVYSNVMGL